MMKEFFFRVVSDTNGPSASAKKREAKRHHKQEKVEVNLAEESSGIGSLKQESAGLTLVRVPELHLDISREVDDDHPPVPLPSDSGPMTCSIGKEDSDLSPEPVELSPI